MNQQRLAAALRVLTDNLPGSSDIVAIGAPLWSLSMARNIASTYIISELSDLEGRIAALESSEFKGVELDEDETRTALTYALKNGAVFSSGGSDSRFAQAIEHLVKVGVLKRAAGFETDVRRAYVLTRGGYDYCEGYGVK